MIKISLPYLVAASSSLDRLDAIVEGRRVLDVYGYLFAAQSQINGLYDQSIYAGTLRSSRELSAALSKNLVDMMGKGLDYEMNAYETFNIRQSRDQFRTAFLAELGVMPTFFVTQKESFDTLSLLEFGVNLFPPSLVEKVPESALDAQQVGRALAFDLGTACGFHLFRVLEAVLRRYYAEVSGGSPPPKVRTIGVYVRAMRQANCGEERVLATLEQIRDLHRNPLVHPETSLTTEDAVSVLGIARSAVASMLAGLPVAAVDPVL